jgi:hypothetical protein
MKTFAAALLCALLAGCASPVPTPPGPSVVPSTIAQSPSSAPATKLVCGRIAQGDCSKVEAMVQSQFAFAANASAIVMDYICQPGERCAVGFNAIVSVLIPLDPAVDYAYWPPTYAVGGLSGPETLRPWVNPLPAAFSTLLRSAGFSG